MRIDRFLWLARLTKTRAAAQALAGGGHMRIDGRRCEKPATPVRVGSVVTFVRLDGVVRVVRVLALPARRGPAVEAAQCWEGAG